MTNEAFAQLSNAFVYSAIAVYALAMIAFAAYLAFGSRGRVGRLAARPAAQSAGAAGDNSGGSTTSAGSSVTRLGSSHASTAVLDEPALLPRRAERLGRIGISLTVLGFGLHLAGTVARGLAAGRAPFGNMYEFSSAAALAAVGAFLVLQRRRDVRYLGVFVMVPVVLALGLAVTVLYTEAEQLVPALQSYWLAIHVTAAIVSFGVLTVGAALSVLYLWRGRAEQRDRVSGVVAMLPSSGALDRMAYRVHAFAFPLWTFAVVAGAIWAEDAWGRYWGWDPKETWAFITWVVYAAYLHARSTAGWRGRRAALIALVGYACFLFNYFGVNIWISGLHSYGGL